eukprot:Pgem_evm1s10297
MMFNNKVNFFALATLAVAGTMTQGVLIDKCESGFDKYFDNDHIIPSKIIQKGQPFTISMNATILTKLDTNDFVINLQKVKIGGTDYTGIAKMMLGSKNVCDLLKEASDTTKCVYDANEIFSLQYETLIPDMVLIQAGAIELGVTMDKKDKLGVIMDKREKEEGHIACFEVT